MFIYRGAPTSSSLCIQFFETLWSREIQIQIQTHLIMDLSHDLVSIHLHAGSCFWKHFLILMKTDPYGEMTWMRAELNSHPVERACLFCDVIFIHPFESQQRISTMAAMLVSIF